jgi:hypothetical protein
MIGHKRDKPSKNVTHIMGARQRTIGEYEALVYIILSLLVNMQCSVYHINVN